MKPTVFQNFSREISNLKTSLLALCFHSCLYTEQQNYVEYIRQLITQKTTVQFCKFHARTLHTEAHLYSYNVRQANW